MTYDQHLVEMKQALDEIVRLKAESQQHAEQIQELVNMLDLLRMDFDSFRDDVVTGL